MTNSMENLKEEPRDDNFKFKAGAFLAGVTGLSLLGGFGMTLNFAKKQDPEMFTKGITTSGKQVAGGSTAIESGGSLALRALGRGTLYSVTGFTIFCYGVWKLMGVQTLAEFRIKMAGVLPAVPRNDPPQSRTEFSGVRDLLQYLIDEDGKKERANAAAATSSTAAVTVSAASAVAVAAQADEA